MLETRTDTTTRLIYGMLLVLLAAVGVLLAADAEVQQRALLVRYWSLFAAAVFAVAAPHVLLPDQDVTLVQMLNYEPRALLERQLGQWFPLIIAFALPILFIAFYDPAGWGAGFGFKAAYAGGGLLTVVGAGLYSFDRYSAIGPASQEWQEGRRGQRFREALEHAPSGARPPVPFGMMPALTATGRVFLVAALFVAASAAATLLGSGWTVLPGLVFVGWTGTKLLRRAPAFDRFYYHTNAFYGELFRGGGSVRAAEREPVPYRAVYWVPSRWRPHVWAGLRQMDRRLPLGRFVILGHLFLWFLFLQDLSGAVIASYLLLFSVAKNAAGGFLASDTLAPPSFQVVLQRPADWFLTRLFVNLRWTAPWLGSLLLVVWAGGDLAANHALLWTAADVVLAALFAALATWRHERRYLRRFA